MARVCNAWDLPAWDAGRLLDEQHRNLYLPTVADCAPINILEVSEDGIAVDQRDIVHSTPLE